MRKTISISIDEEVWQHIELSAKEDHRSTSRYIELLGRLDGIYGLSKIEHKINQLQKIQELMQNRAKTPCEKDIADAYSNALNTLTDAGRE